MYRTDENDCDSIDRQFATQHFTRYNEAEIRACFDSVKRDKSWTIVSEPHEYRPGWWGFAAKGGA